jgi:hypothetical protein
MASLKFSDGSSRLISPTDATGFNNITIAGWVRDEQDAANVGFFTFANGAVASATHFFGCGRNFSTDKVRYQTSTIGSSDTTHAAATNTWYYVAITASSTGPAVFVKVSTDGLTFAYSGDIGPAVSGSAFPVKSWNIGVMWDSVNAVSTAFRYVRVWSEVVSDANLVGSGKEALSATPVRTTNLLADYPLSSDTDVADAYAAYDLTKVGSGYTTTASEPTMGSSSSTPVGLIRPRQQFAFSSAIARHS